MLELHQRVYIGSGGWIGHRLLWGVPNLLLHTVGRRTGLPRTVALTYGVDAGDFLVTASNGGSHTAPGWLHNLDAQPGCEIQVGRRRLPATAAAIVYPGETEYERLWQIVRIRGRGRYGRYRKMTSRKIAIVRLRPVTERTRSTNRRR